MFTKEPQLPPPHYYAPIPIQYEQNCIVLPSYYELNNDHRGLLISKRRRTMIVMSLLLLAACVYAFWPSDPTVKIERIKLKKMHVHILPVLSIDLSMKLKVKVRNADLYSMDYQSVDVGVGYRGKRLGHVKSGGGHVAARSSSYMDAELDFKGVRILSDVVLFLEDLARGRVPFDTVTEIDGKVGFLFFEFPLKAKLSCEVLVNSTNQTIARQNCYP